MFEAYKNPATAVPTLTRPIALAPMLFSSHKPAGAPAARAPYEAIPLHEITCVVYAAPTRPIPQVVDLPPTVSPIRPSDHIACPIRIPIDLLRGRSRLIEVRRFRGEPMQAGAGV